MMKSTTIKKIATTTFAIALLLGSISFANAEGTNTNEKAKETQTTKTKEYRGCYVKANDIISYLENLGYSNITLTNLLPSCNVIAHTDYGYDTVVFVSSTAVIGHEDVDM